MIGLLVADGYPVVAYQAVDPTEVLGCNDRAELATLRALLKRFGPDETESRGAAA